MSAARSAPFVDDHTVLIPVMNGVDTGERMRNLLKKGTVIDSLIYIVAYASPDFSITQIGNLASLRDRHKKCLKGAVRERP